MAGSAALSPDSPLFKLYLFWSAVLVIKVSMMSFLTSRQKRRKLAFSNPEDAKLRGGKVNLDDPDVMRVKRAHLNDLENVVPFLILCPLYLATGPSVWLAGTLIRTFAAARIAHSVFYLNEVSSMRSASFGVGVTVTSFMAGCTILYAW